MTTESLESFTLIRGETLTCWRQVVNILCTFVSGQLVFLSTRYIESDWSVWSKDAWMWWWRVQPGVGVKVFSIVAQRKRKKKINILLPLVFSPTPPDPPPASCRVPWRLCPSWAAAWLVSPAESTPPSCPSPWWTSRWDSTWIWPCCRVTCTQRSCDTLVLHPRLVLLGF